MNRNSFPTPFRAGAGALALGLTLQLNACANPGASNDSAAADGQQTQQQTQTMQAPTDANVPAMDQLANDMTQYREVYRVGESVILPLPDQTLFREPGSVVISNEGGTLLTRIGEILRQYPDTQVFIQEYVPAGEIKVQTRKHAMDQAYIIRSELIGRNIPPQRLVVDIEPRKPRAQEDGGDQAQAPEALSLQQHRFDLHIVPYE